MHKTKSKDYTAGKQNYITLSMKGVVHKSPKQSNTKHYSYIFLFSIQDLIRLDLVLHQYQYHHYQFKLQEIYWRCKTK